MVDAEIAEIAEITWTNVLKIWWAWFWRATLGGLVTGAGLGFVIGVIGGVMGADENSITAGVTPIALLGGFVWGIVALRMALTKRYGDFHIVLVNDKGGDLQPLLSRHLSRPLLRSVWTI